MNIERKLRSFHPLLCGAALTLLLAATGCSDSSSGRRSSGTPVNPESDPGAARTGTARATGAQPRRY